MHVFVEEVQILRKWLYKSLDKSLWRVKIQGHMLSSSLASSLSYPTFFLRDREGGSRSEKERKGGKNHY